MKHAHNHRVRTIVERQPLRACVQEGLHSPERQHTWQLLLSLCCRVAGATADSNQHSADAAVVASNKLACGRLTTIGTLSVTCVCLHCQGLGGASSRHPAGSLVSCGVQCKVAIVAPCSCALGKPQWLLNDTNLVCATRHKG